MKVNEVAEKIGMSRGRVMNLLHTWKEGQIVQGYNVEGLKSYIKLKFGEEEASKRLGIPVDELTVEVGVRTKTPNGIEIEDLEEGNRYILRNFHFETSCEYLGETEVGNVTLWIFRTDKGYKAIDEETINNGHFKIIAE